MRAWYNMIGQHAQRCHVNDADALSLPSEEVWHRWTYIRCWSRSPKEIIRIKKCVWLFDVWRCMYERIRKHWFTNTQSPHPNPNLSTWQRSSQARDAAGAPGPRSPNLNLIYKAVINLAANVVASLNLNMCSRKMKSKFEPPGPNL